MCRRTVGWLRRLDWLGRLEFVDLAKAEDLPVTLEIAMTGMPMRTRDGRSLVGFRAVRRALIQTPAGALVAWVMYVPGVSAVGERVYKRVATNRRRDGVSCRASGGVGA